jgi:hypothetical protein
MRKADTDAYYLRFGDFARESDTDVVYRLTMCEVENSRAMSRAVHYYLKFRLRHGRVTSADSGGYHDFFKGYIIDYD